MRDPAAFDVLAFRAFDLVVSLGSATSAAARLGVGQPHVSRLVRRLERAVGAALLVRRGRALHPTEEGLLFHREVASALEGWDGAMAAARALGAGDGRPALRILAQQHVAHGVLVPVLAALAARRVRFVLDIRARHAAADWTGRSAFDVAISNQRMSLGGYRCVPAFAVPLGIALPAGHALAARGSLEAADLAGLRLVALRAGLPGRDRLDRYCGAARVVPAVVAETGSAVSALQFAAAGVGAALADALTAQAVEATGAVVFRRLRGMADQSYFLLLREGATPHPALPEFRRLLTRQAALAAAAFDAPPGALAKASLLRHNGGIMADRNNGPGA